MQPAPQYKHPHCERLSSVQQSASCSPLKQRGRPTCGQLTRAAQSASYSQPQACEHRKFVQDNRHVQQECWKLYSRPLMSASLWCGTLCMSCKQYLHARTSCCIAARKGHAPRACAPPLDTLTGSAHIHGRPPVPFDGVPARGARGAGVLADCPSAATRCVCCPLTGPKTSGGAQKRNHTHETRAHLDLDVTLAEGARGRGARRGALSQPLSEATPVVRVPARQ